MPFPWRLTPLLWIKQTSTNPSHSSSSAEAGRDTPPPIIVVTRWQFQYHVDHAYIFRRNRSDMLLYRGVLKVSLKVTGLWAFNGEGNTSGYKMMSRQGYQRVVKAQGIWRAEWFTKQESRSKTWNKNQEGSMQCQLQEAGSTHQGKNYWEEFVDNGETWHVSLGLPALETRVCPPDKQKAQTQEDMKFKVRLVSLCLYQRLLTR